MAIDLSAIPSQHWFGRLLRWPLRLIPKSAVLPILQGPLRGKWWIAGSSVHGCWLGTYEHEKQQVFREHVRKGDVVYDVGAHVGFYTLLASVQVGSEGRVIAIEPLPRNIGYLRRHLEANAVENVEVVESVLAERSGQARMTCTSDSSQAHLDEEGDIEVRCRTLDELVFGEGFPAPDVLKLDVEGAEQAVLSGGRRVLAERRPVIFVATHGARAKADCRTLLLESGYEVRPIGAEAVEDTDELLGLPFRSTIKVRRDSCTSSRSGGRGSHAP